MTKYDVVEFVFIEPGKLPATHTGTVLDRGTEMVLEIPWVDGDYHIVGKRLPDGRYHGPHLRLGAVDDVKVAATWEKVAGSYSGTWIEDGVQYTFSFTLV